MFAQNEELAVGTTIGGTAKDVCRFSLGVKGGINYLRISDQSVNPAFGGFAEITVNPLWGFGLEYMYLMNDREGTVFTGRHDLESTVHNVVLYGSLNLSNLISKYRSHGWQKWNLYANGGAGISIYDWKLKGTDSEGDGVTPVALLGLNLEYNVAKWLALGLDGQYRFYSDEKFVGKNAGSSMFGANLSARFKFGGDKNVRNMALVNYEPQVKVNQRANVYRRQIAKLTVQADDQKAVIDELLSQIKNIRDSLDYVEKACASRQAPTAFRYSPTEEWPNKESIYFRVEFESGKDVIKQSFYSSLDDLVSFLKKHPDWPVILRGYADNTGNEEKNIQLSKNRANVVKNYLVSKGISASSIEVFGYGSTNPVASNNTPTGKAQNRRVEIEVHPSK
jgi:OOP family OmpA-OmpF porin